MNTQVKVQWAKNPERAYVWETPEVKEPLELTRLIQVIVPPDDTSPGYACVLGEVFDGDTRQKSRQKILLDEAVALDPDDFSEKEKESFWDRLYYRALVEEEGKWVERVEPYRDHPTLEDLRLAAVALKDLWKPRRAFTPPGEEEFYHYIRRTEGLMTYPPTVSDEDLERWYPFFGGRHRHVGVQCDVPFGTDQGYADSLVATLIRRRTLQVNPNCLICVNLGYTSVNRAIALGCNALEYWDATLKIREKKPSDGYSQELSDAEMQALNAAFNQPDSGGRGRLRRPRPSQHAHAGLRGRTIRQSGLTNPLR